MKAFRKAYIALGSNIEPKVSHLQQAITYYQADDTLEAVVPDMTNVKLEVTGISSVYDTVPKGYSDQDNFLNMAIEIYTNLDAKSLLKIGQYIEKALHRVKEFVNGPRTIDCDILFIEEESFTDDELEIPHPRMQERAFVLFPLAEIAGGAEVPLLNKTVTELKASLPEDEKADVRQLGRIEELND